MAIYVANPLKEGELVFKNHQRCEVAGMSWEAFVVRNLFHNVYLRIILIMPKNRRDGTSAMAGESAKLSSILLGSCAGQDRTRKMVS